MTLEIQNQLKRVGNEVRRIRESRRITIDELAAKNVIEKDRYVNFEKGEILLSVEDFYKVMNYLHVNGVKR